MIISQYEKPYLQLLISYNKILQQRNALLKSIQETRKLDPLALQIWDDQLIEIGNKIFEYRTQFLAEFTPVFNEIYHAISGGNESVSLNYKSQLQDAKFEDLLKESLPKEKYVGYTTKGTHKDDYSFEIEEKPLKKYGSQGQQKTFLIALKLAQFKHIESKTNTKPILLLDDIYDKLDEERISHLMSKICKGDYGQVFITDTNTSRLPAFFKKKKHECFAFEIEKGELVGKSKKSNSN